MPRKKRQTEMPLFSGIPNPIQITPDELESLGIPSEKPAAPAWRDKWSRNGNPIKQTESLYIKDSHDCGNEFLDNPNDNSFPFCWKCGYAIKNATGKTDELNEALEI